jgi:putative ABC transport system permease protein
MFRKFLRKTPLAWLQLKREPTRLAVALAGIAFADILIFFQLGLAEGLFDSVTKPYSALQGDLFLINPLFESLSVVRSFPRQHLYQAAGASGVQSINYLYIDQGRWRNPQTLKNQTTMVFAINPNDSAMMLPEVRSQLNQLNLLNRILYDRTGPTALFGDILEPLSQGETVPIQFNNVQTQVIGTFTMGASFTANGNIITSHSRSVESSHKTSYFSGQVRLAVNHSSSEPWNSDDLIPIANSETCLTIDAHKRQEFPSTLESNTQLTPCRFASSLH